MLIVSDLDGTLLGGDSQLTDRTVAAVCAAHDAGIEVVAATGRSWRSALPKLTRVPIRFVVCSNGGLIWDRNADEVWLTRPIPGPTAVAARAAVLESGLPAGFGWEALTGFHFDDHFKAACPRVDEIGLGDDPGPLSADTEPIKMFMCVTGHRRLALQNAVRAVLPAGVTASASGADFVETTREDVDKATTMTILADHLGVAARDIVAFGDQLNDVPLLQWAGHSVAMANAHDNVTQHANEIAPSNLDDGVAVTIERML